MIRSFLFVPADSERKLAKAAVVGADALILDLEDAVAEESRPLARSLARDYLVDSDNIWVRINPVGTPAALEDVKAIMPSAPTGIFLPKAASADDLLTLQGWVERLEAEHGITPGSTQILPLCTEQARALFTLDSYIDASPRLAGLTWGAEDLSAALGASQNRDDHGNWLPTYTLARSMCLIAAAAARVPAYDTVFTDFRNEEGLARYAGEAQRDGFSGMLAIHPAQIAVINEAFIPTPKQIERARKIVALFAGNPGAGTLGLDGQMIDKPHLVQAQKLLERVTKGN